MALLPELVEEVLIRFPPSEPHLLVRNILICKQWREIISAPHFGLRYRQFHRTAPLLGLMVNFRDEDDESVSRLVPVSPACPRHADLVNWCTLDARHGRVLLGCMMDGGQNELAVWDPISYLMATLPPVQPGKAAVLCAANGVCNHLGCHSGPFYVVSLSIGAKAMWLRVYSSYSGSWSKPTYVAATPRYCVDRGEPATVVGDMVYFPIDVYGTIVSYNLASHQTSLINFPTDFSGSPSLLITMDDGELGLATVDVVASRLSLRKMEVCSSNGDIEWTHIRTIEIGKLLPEAAHPFTSYDISYAHGVGAIFVKARNMIFSLDIRTCQVDEFELPGDEEADSILPYLSFHNPAFHTGAGPTVGAAVI